MAVIRKLFRTDGTSMDLPKGMDWDALKNLMGADTIDTVILRHMGNPMHVMLVDDNGYEVQEVQISPTHFERRPVRARKPLNVEATRLYHLNCKPGVEHQIVGHVIVMPDEDFA